MGGDEAVVVADAVHPTLAARAGGFAPAQEKLAIEPTSGRRRRNFHGAIEPGCRAGMARPAGAPNVRMCVLTMQRIL